MTLTKECKLVTGTCTFQGREPCENQVYSSNTGVSVLGVRFWEASEWGFELVPWRHGPEQNKNKTKGHMLCLDSAVS